MNWSMLFNIAGGVGLFLYGIKLMSEALQFIAGEKMRHLISTVTKTPLRGVFVGILVTVLIQSSSGATVMTVSFVNAGLMTLKQAVGIIMGANVGTTVTAQIIAFNIQSMSLPFIAVGVALCIFGKTKKLNYLGNGIVGLGLLFMGMQTMSNATKFMAGQKELLQALSGNPLFGVIAGMLVTMIVQSSAATIGLTMAMASQGLISIDGAIPIILGDNIGTTITAVLASIGTSRSAKQAATAHVLFNSIGVCVFLLAFPLFKIAVIASATDVGRQIANAHAIFNVVNTILFLPFAGPFAKLVEKIIPNAPAPKQTSVTLYLDKKLIAASSTAALTAVKDELMYMSAVVTDMMNLVRRGYSESPDAYDEIFATFEENEDNVNAINIAIGHYASDVWQKGLNADGSTVLGCYVNAASDLERVADHLENLMELCPSIVSHMTESAMDEFWAMFNTVDESFTTAVLSLDEENINKADYVIKNLENKINAMEKQYRTNHIIRLNQGDCDPERGVNFVALLSNLERIGDHSENIAGYTCDIVGLSSPVHKYKMQKAKAATA